MRLLNPKYWPNFNLTHEQWKEWWKDVTDFYVKQKASKNEIFMNTTEPSKDKCPAEEMLECIARANKIAQDIVNERKCKEKPIVLYTVGVEIMGLNNNPVMLKSIPLQYNEAKFIEDALQNRYSTPVHISKHFI